MRTARKRVAADHEATIISTVQSALNTTQKIVLFTTHPDKDHYNEVPAIFDESFLKTFAEHKKVTFIFSGFEDQYTVPPFPTWLATIRALNNPNIEIIFTGLQDDGAVSAVAAVQTRYRSSDAPHTPSEKRLGELRTEIIQGYGLKIDILSLNTGVDETMSLSDAQRPKLKNTNSLVMRVVLVDAQRELPTSILLPGDAEGETWKYVMSNPALQSQHQVTHMVLSHHGSSTHDALTDKLLDYFKPQIFFISNGRYCKYRHPDEAGMTVLSNYLRSHSRLSTDVHRLSYYPTGEKKKLSRSWIPAPIFATLNNGTITINLHDSAQINVSHNKLPIFHVSGTLSSFRIVGGPTIVSAHSYQTSHPRADQPKLWNRAPTRTLEVTARPDSLTDAAFAELRQTYPDDIPLHNLLIRQGSDGQNLIYPLEPLS